MSANSNFSVIHCEYWDESPDADCAGGRCYSLGGAATLRLARNVLAAHQAMGLDMGPGQYEITDWLGYRVDHHTGARIGGVDADRAYVVVPLDIASLFQSSPSQKTRRYGQG